MGQGRGRGLTGSSLWAGLPRALVWRAGARGGGVPVGRGGANRGRGSERPNGGGSGGCGGGAGLGELGDYRSCGSACEGPWRLVEAGGWRRRHLAMVGVPGAAAFQRKQGEKAGG